MSWYDYAACRGQDPEMFFPVGVSELAQRQLQRPTVCAGCSVRSLCLEFAVLAGVEHGVWGGLGEDERHATNRRIRRHGRPLAPQTLTL